MRVIDLLNKIANGEQPKTIKYRDDVYEFDCYEGDWGYVNKEYCRYKWFANEIDCDLKEQLNDEVEIIEENKKIGKLYLNDEYLFSNNLSKEFTREDRRLLDSNFKELGNKINEIIDYLNKGGNNNE